MLLFNFLDLVHAQCFFHLKSQDSVLSQKVEEAKQMKQDVQRAQSLFTSAEKELRYEKEKSLDLKRHNTLLEQEKLKVVLSVLACLEFPKRHLPFVTDSS